MLHAVAYDLVSAPDNSFSSQYYFGQVWNQLAMAKIGILESVSMLPTLCYMFLDRGAGGEAIEVLCVINYLLFVCNSTCTSPLSFD